MYLNPIPRTELEEYLAAICLKLLYLELDEQTCTAVEWQNKIAKFLTKVPEACKVYLESYKQVLRLYPDKYVFMEDVVLRLIRSPVVARHFINNIQDYLINPAGLNHDQIWEDLLNEADEKLTLIRLLEDDNKIQQHYNKTGGAGGRRSKISGK